MTHNVVWNTVVFISWTVTSFLCHHFAKKYLQQSNLYGVLVISGFQIALCYSSLKVGLCSSNKQTTKIIGGAGHIIATIATNYSLSLVHASSTLAIKTLEPITSAIIQRLILSTPIPFTTTLSLPMIVIGAITFTGSPFGTSATTFGFGLALVSNLALAARNITMKVLFEEDNKLLPRSLSDMLLFPTLTLSIVYLLHSLRIIDDITGVAFVIISAASHVVYSFLSVALVLKSVSVVTHAILNIFKRVFVVLLLSFFGTRTVSVLNISGLLLASFGLGVYIIGKTRKSSSKASYNPDIEKMNSQLIMCLIFCVGIVSFGLLSSVHFPPNVVDQTVTRKVEETSHLSRNTDKLSSAVWESIHVNYSFPDTSRALSQEDFGRMVGPILGYPFETNKNLLSRNTIDDVITETQNLHFQLFNKLIGQYPYVVLVDMSINDKKEDSAVGVGEILLISRLKKKLIFFCTTIKCGEKQLGEAREKALSFGRDKVAILFHSGGNLFSHSGHNEIRNRTFRIFFDFKIVTFPQSVGINSSQSLLAERKTFSRYPNVTILIRDNQSLERARQHFSTNNLVLAPDIAFLIGSVPRSLRPHYDILWIKSSDVETSRYNVSDLKTDGFSVMVDDWISWMTSNRIANSFEKINIDCEMGFTFLQRGRVAITDRLHGHILATLLHMPHVLLDTSDNKLAAYHNTWTKGLEGSTVLTAKTPQDALDKAVVLLERFKDTLPKIFSYMDLTDGEV